MEKQMDNIDNIKHRIETEGCYEQTKERMKALYSIVSETESLSKDQEKINCALNLMLLAHFQQKDRPDGQPYINHPLDVALHLTNEYRIFDPEMIVAALLHDTVEDNAKSILIWGDRNIDEQESLEIQALQVIDEQFGKSVSELVSTLTNPDFNLEAKRLAKNKEDEDNIKLQLYLEHFESIYDDNAWAFVIKMADFSQNALHLNLLEESLSKDWFRRKYGPVILMVIQRLKNLDDTLHPLFNVKESISKKLIEVYESDYRGAT